MLPMLQLQMRVMFHFRARCVGGGGAGGGAERERDSEIVVPGSRIFEIWKKKLGRIYLYPVLH